MAKTTKKHIVGYTAGVFDLFHIGHLNLLKNAKKYCDELVVGVSTDELVVYKNKKPVIPQIERMEIVKNIQFVDRVISQNDRDKYKIWEELKFDILFVGDDWKGSPFFNDLEKKLNAVNVLIKYFPYTVGTSSTLINQILVNIKNEQ